MVAARSTRRHLNMLSVYSATRQFLYILFLRAKSISYGNLVQMPKLLRRGPQMAHREHKYGPLRPPSLISQLLDRHLPKFSHSLQYMHPVSRKAGLVTEI